MEELDWEVFKVRNAERVRLKAEADLIMAELKASLTTTVEVKAMYDRLVSINKALQDKWKAKIDEAQEISFELYPYQVAVECKLDDLYRNETPPEKQ